MLTFANRVTAPLACVAAFAAILVLVSGCETEAPVVPTPFDSTVVTISNVRPDSTDELYYSFELGRLLTRDERTILGWDIRLPYILCCGNTKSISLRLNSGDGASGNTRGAVVNARWEQVTSVPAGVTFRADDSSKPVVPLPVLGPSAFFVYDIATHTLRPSPDKVLLVKTSSGKVFKFQVVSIYKDAEPNPTQETPIGFYHFRSAQLPQ